MKKIFTILLLLVSTEIYGQNMDESSENSRGPKNRMGNRIGDRGAKMSFNFWFRLPSKSPSGMYRKQFDDMSVLEFDKELIVLVTNTKMLREEFDRDMQLLKVQSRYCIEQLKNYLQDQENGIDRSREIVSSYQKIFEIAQAREQLMRSHTIQLVEVFDDMSSKSEQRINKSLEEAQDNPQQLVSNLLEMYRMSIK